MVLIKHECTQCEFKATLKQNLQRHIRSVHEGQKFSCIFCEYKATYKGNLHRHIKSVHEGQKFQCPQCEYKATQKVNLQTHIKSVHEGQQFQCPKNSQGTHCEYLADLKDVSIEELYLEASQHVADLEVEISELEKLSSEIK